MNFNYVTQFILGGSLFTLMYHFTKMNNTVVSSIIPAFPVVFLTGYMYLIYFKGDVLEYTNNTIYTFGLDFLFMILLYVLLYYVVKNYIFQ